MYLFYPCRTDAIKRTMTLRFVAFKAIENIRKSSTESGVRNCKPNHDESHRKWNSQVPWTLDSGQRQFISDGRRNKIPRIERKSVT